MVELSTRKREMWGYRGNLQEKLGLKRILCVSQLTISNTAGSSPDPAYNYTDTRSSQPNEASRTPGSLISACIPHIVLIFIPHLSLSSPQPNYDRRTQSQVIPLYLSMPWSWVDTEYSIRRVQHPAKIICLPFILMMSSRPLNVASASGVPPYTIDRHQPGLHESSMIKSPCHIPMVASQITDEQSPSTQRAVHQLPPNTRPNSLDYGPRTRNMTASKCISIVSLLWPPSSHDHGLQVHICKLAWSRPPSVSPNSLNHGIPVRTIMASKYIYTLTRSWPPSASPNSLNHSLQVYLWTRLITASKFAWSRCPSASPNSHDHGLRVYLSLPTRHF